MVVPESPVTVYGDVDAGYVVIPVAKVGSVVTSMLYVIASVPPPGTGVQFTANDAPVTLDVVTLAGTAGQVV